MDHIYNILKKRKSFYSLIERYNVIKEDVFINNNDKITVKSRLKINNNNLNFIFKKISNVFHMDNIDLEVEMILNKSFNSIDYELKNIPQNIEEELFRTHGNLLFDNENNLLLHESSIETNSKIIKCMNLKPILEKNVEKDVQEIFLKMGKLLI